MAMQYIFNLVKYFKHQAVSNPHLMHDDAAGQRVFEVTGIEEAFGALRTGIRPKSYLMRLILPQFGLSKNGAHGIKYWEVGILVAKYHGSRDRNSDDYIEAISNSEMVGDDIIEKIISDGRAGHPLFSRLLQNADQLNLSGEVASFVGDGTYSGVVYVINIPTFRRLHATCEDAVAWTDGGVTPHNL